MLAGEVWEPQTHELVAKLLNQRSGSMVHAGAFFGDMLPSFSSACSGTLFAFEPVLENFVLSQLCVQANELSNVALLHAALGQAHGVGRITTKIPDEQVHAGGASRMSTSGQLVPILTIDALDIVALRVIQLDIEGYELPALLGGLATIRRERPVVLIEDNKGQCTPLLKGLSYVYLGRIPGLSIWCPETDCDWVDPLLQSVTRSSS